MTGAIRRLWVALLSLAMVAAEAVADETLVPAAGGDYKMYSESKALLIGSVKYDDPDWDELNSITPQIAKLEAFLTEQGFAVEKLISPTGQELRTKLRSFMLTTSSKGRALVYFSGHGWSDPKDYNAGYLVPTDAPSPYNDLDKFRERALSMYDLQGIVPAARAKHTLILVDSCFSASLFQNRSATPTRPKTAAPDYAFWEEVGERNLQFITAGNETQKVPAASPFVDLFIAAIKTGQAAPESPGFVMASDVGRWLKIQLRPGGQLSPQTGIIGVPPHGEDSEGDMVFLKPPQPPEIFRGPVPARFGPSHPGQRRQESLLRARYQQINPPFDPRNGETVAALTPPKNPLSLRNNLLQNKVLGEYDPLTRFGDVEIRYYRKAKDGRAVMDALDDLVAPYQARPAQLNQLSSNTIACSADVDFEVVKALAFLLLENGVDLKLIHKFRNPDVKANRVEILSTTGLETFPILTTAQVDAMTECGPWPF